MCFEQNWLIQAALCLGLKLLSGPAESQETAGITVINPEMTECQELIKPPGIAPGTDTILIFVTLILPVSD